MEDILRSRKEEEKSERDTDEDDGEGRICLCDDTAVSTGRCEGSCRTAIGKGRAV